MAELNENGVEVNVKKLFILKHDYVIASVSFVVRAVNNY